MRRSTGDVWRWGLGAGFGFKVIFRGRTVGKDAVDMVLCEEQAYCISDVVVFDI